VVDEALGKLPFKPTADVVETVAWLKSDGFVLVEVAGPHGMGNQLLGFERADGVRVRLVTDRGQWMADLKLPGWPRMCDLDSVLEAATGSAPWEADDYEDLPVQLPPGVRWREAIPRAIAWALGNPGAAAEVKRAQSARGRRLFG
jgi:hypothetical protein